MSDIGDNYDDDDVDEETEDERDEKLLRAEKLNLDVHRTTALGYTAEDIKVLFLAVLAAAWLLPFRVFTAMAAVFVTIMVLWLIRAVRLVWAYVNEQRR